MTELPRIVRLSTSTSTHSSRPPCSSARINVTILVRLAGGSRSCAFFSYSTAPDGSSISTAASAWFAGGAGIRSFFGSGAAVHGSGSRCGTIAAAFGATSSAGGATSRAELVLVASLGDSVSTVAGAGAGEGADVPPEEQAATRTNAITKKVRRRWRKLVIKQEGPP